MKETACFQLSLIILSQESMFLGSYSYLQDFWSGSYFGLVPQSLESYQYILQFICSGWRSFRQEKNEFIRLFLNKVDFGFSVRFGHSRERISKLVRYFLMNFDWHVPLIFIYNFCLKSGSKLCEEGPRKIQYLKRIKLNFSAEPDRKSTRLNSSH